MAWIFLLVHWTFLLYFCIYLSVLVRVCINCNSSLPDQVFIMGTYSSSLRWYTFAWSTFVTSISKFTSSTYLSGVFKSNAGWLSIHSACLVLCGSSWLLLLVCGSIGRSVSLIALTSTVAAWIATCVMGACISSGFSIISHTHILSAFKFLSACGVLLCV